MDTEVIFSVSNHHVSSCGVPPRVGDAPPGFYRGYFENAHGEQAIFVYEHATGEGVVYLGDAGWEEPRRVVDGAVPGLILNGPERDWLAACWAAAKRA
jgi:hypothetical protein